MGSEARKGSREKGRKKGWREGERKEGEWSRKERGYKREEEKKEGNKKGWGIKEGWMEVQLGEIDGKYGRKDWGRSKARKVESTGRKGVK